MRGGLSALSQDKQVKKDKTRREDLMTESIRLYRSEFGQLSILNVANNFVTHAHDEIHIIIWLDGVAGKMTVGRDTMALGPGIAAGINSFEPHSHLLAHDGASGLFLAFYIDPNWLCRRRGLPLGSSVFAQPFIALDSWIRGAAESLLASLSERDGADDLVAYEIVRFIDAFIDAADAEAPRRSHAARICSMQDFRVRKAIELMKAHVRDRICFDEVARSAGLSRPHFFALFREQMNLTPNVYWNTLRVREAVRQVQFSEESLTSVAGNLGFTSQGNFSRFFRDHIGVPPTVYRSASRAA
jgi:AraC family transcriptional regulator